MNFCICVGFLENHFKTINVPNLTFSQLLLFFPEGGAVDFWNSLAHGISRCNLVHPEGGAGTHALCGK